MRPSSTKSSPNSGSITLVRASSTSSGVTMGLECSRAFCVASADRLVHGTAGRAPVLRGRGHRDKGLPSCRSLACPRRADRRRRRPWRAHLRRQLAHAGPRDRRAPAAHRRPPAAPAQRAAAGLARDRDRRREPAARRRRRSSDAAPGLSRPPARPRAAVAGLAPAVACGGPMLPLLVLLFIVVPIAELYVIIQVGEAIGVLPTFALLIVD